MKKKLFIINVISFMLIALFMTGSCYAETKKVLVLQIIEENWDDLEFSLPKYDMVVGRSPEPMTKKEALKDFEEYKEKAIKKDLEIKEAIKGDVVKTVRLTVLKSNIPPQKTIPESMENSLYIKHEIAYLGKAYYLKEGDTFVRAAFRGGVGFRKMNFDYYYNNLPKKVSLLFEQKYFDKTAEKIFPQAWNYFEEIRLVEDIYIDSVDSSGNLKIKYNDKAYSVTAGAVVELPIQEKILTRQEMMQFREKYFEYYAKAYPWVKPEEYNMYIITSFLDQISISNESFHFGTKVTIINHGFEEIQGD